MPRVLLAGLFLIALLPATAAAQSSSRFQLRTAPIVDVGSVATFNLSARHWPPGIGVTVRMVSPHHNFNGPMHWARACGCYQARVRMVWRDHPLEKAYVAATVTGRSGMVGRASTTFHIRGLLPGGKRFAPGGTPILSAWVSDPTPSAGEDEHFCAWLHASDNFPIAGVKVHVQVHLGGGDVVLSAGHTNQNGVTCARYALGHLPPHEMVKADVTAAGRTTRVTFRPS